MSNFASTYQTQFSGQTELLLQQRMSMFRQAVTVGDYRGSKGGQVVTQFGQLEGRIQQARFEPIVPANLATDQRHVYPKKAYEVDWISDLDQLQTKVGLLNPLADAISAGIVRKLDKIIIDGIAGPNRTGEDGANITNFPSSQIVDRKVGGGNANTGLNYQKLIRAKTILRKNFVSQFDEVWMALSAEQEADLMNQVEYINSTYKAGNSQVLEDGRLVKFLGINFLQSEQLPTFTDGSDVIRKNFMWVKRGVHLGMWRDLNIRITERDTEVDFPWQVFGSIVCGATRTQEKMVVEVDNLEPNIA